MASCFLGCQSPDKIQLSAKLLHEWNEELEKAIVNDFFSPPVASRIYCYPNMAAYEVLAQQHALYNTISQQYKELATPLLKAEAQNELIALYAFYYTSIELVYSIENLQQKKLAMELELMNQGVQKTTIAEAETAGKKMAKAILLWAKKDGYAAMRSYNEYTPLQEEGKWIPTPPDYSAALEPHWKQLRPFILTSADQFQPEPPTQYTLDTASAFYQEVIEVYEALKNNTDETTAIAKFWDCNPLVKKHQGHVTFAEKKLTPGGHWVNIGRMAMQREGYDLMETAHLYTLLTVGIYEAFISCWDEKYRSNYIRPVTVIQEFIDPHWSPILYTPNFPEYPSGHSVVSASAASILTQHLGEQYAFTDSTEVPYGMAPRSFSSFFAAADEAAISRLYGGIHFMPAIENGKVQGRKVGQQVLKTLQLKKSHE